jgi:hypothetical protein
MNRIDITYALLLNAAVTSGCWQSGDQRVGEVDAAALLGWEVGSLRNARTEGRGPPHYRVGGGGSKVSYRIYDLAVWLESQCTIFSSNSTQLHGED